MPARSRACCGRASCACGRSARLVADTMSFAMSRSYGADIEAHWYIGHYVLPGNVQKVILKPKALPYAPEAPRSRRTDRRLFGARRSHSITSSARASKVAGMSRPIVLAVLRLITSSNVAGCSIGISPGFAPEMIFFT